MTTQLPKQPSFRHAKDAPYQLEENLVRHIRAEPKTGKTQNAFKTCAAILADTELDVGILYINSTDNIFHISRRVPDKIRKDKRLYVSRHSMNKILADPKKQISCIEKYKHKILILDCPKMEEDNYDKNICSIINTSSDPKSYAILLITRKPKQ